MERELVERAPLYGDIANELQQMADNDQQLRRDRDWAMAEQEDRQRADRLRQIISEIGWPTNSKVGTEAAHAAWLIVQHADQDPAWQAECLQLMRAAPEHEVSPGDIAYLEDRVMVSQDKPQRFGTQFFVDAVGVYGPNPIDDPDHLDQRRIEAGLGPFAEYKAELEKTWAEAQRRFDAEQKPFFLDPTIDIMQRLGKKKWVHALVLTLGLLPQGVMKTGELRVIHQAEQAAAGERTAYIERQIKLGSQRQELDEKIGYYNPFSAEEELQGVEDHEAAAKELRETFRWWHNPRNLKPPDTNSEHAVEGREALAVLSTSDIRSRDPVYDNREVHIPADTLDTILKNDFPRGWVDTEIESVTQADTTIMMDKSYGIDGIEAAHCATDEHGHSRILLSNGARRESMLWNTLELLPHEVAHANDWLRDSEMTLDERIQLLYDVVKRVDAPDRWKSVYVEEIKNEDPQLQTYKRSIEYFAEISAAYMHTPDKLNKKDFDIVDRAIRRTDPNFDVRKSINHRAQVVWDMQSKGSTKR